MEQNTVLLVMDMQLAVLAGLPDSKTVLNNIVKAIAKARSKNILVIYVVVGFRSGAPEISQQNKIFGGNKERFSSPNMDDIMKIHPDLAPKATDIIVTKRRISAFTGSDLEVILRAQCIQHLILTGVATSGVVLSTLREAADKDFRISVLEDCCGDSDEELHDVLTTKIFVRQANVMTVKEWSEDDTSF